jgi:uncharacterized protein with HEPN domain
MSTKREVRDYLNDILESIGDIHDAFAKSLNLPPRHQDTKYKTLI